MPDERDAETEALLAIADGLVHSIRQARERLRAGGIDPDQLSLKENAEETLILYEGVVIGTIRRPMPHTQNRHLRP